MRRTISLFLSAALLLGALGACQKEGAKSGLGPADHTAKELVDAAYLASGYDESADVEYLTTEEGGDDMLSAYLENAYQLEVPWEDAAIIRAGGASAFEVAVLRVADEEAAVRTASNLMSYIFTRQGDFAGYAPNQADMVAQGGVMQNGPYAGLFICPDPDGAQTAVETVLNGESFPVAGSDTSAGAVTDVKKLRDRLVSDQGMEDAGLEKLDDSAREALNTYVGDAYGLTPDQWGECAIARGTGESVFEVAVFRVRAAVGDVEQHLNVYLNEREAQLDPSSDSAKLLHQAITIVADNYVVMLACPDAEHVAWSFANASGTMGFGYSPRYRYVDTDPNYPDRCAFTAPNEDDMSLYDTSAIRAAWEKADPSSLSIEDKKIYDQARKVLEQVLTGGMSDYEKEMAIYDWVVNNVDYDWTHQDRRETTPRESFTPYGGLVNRTAVCLGYATTFQLLMDLAGVECITVPGAAFESREDHGWNMVRLNGQWYCVDVTWDANMREQTGIKGLENWRYFNVTSDYMAETDHQWDYANTPEATAGD